MQLVSVSDGHQLWADVYDARLGERFSGEIEIANSISGELGEQLGLPLDQGIQIAGLEGPDDLASLFNDDMTVDAIHFDELTDPLVEDSDEP